MPTLAITVESKIAKTTGTPIIVCGNSDYTVIFDFDEEWNAYTEKTAEFRYYRDGERHHDEVLFSGDTVNVPILRDVDEVDIGVYAGNIRTTTGARIACRRCITDGSAAADIPAEDVYNELMEMLLGGAYLITDDGDFVVTGTGDYIMAKE